MIGSEKIVAYVDGELDEAGRAEVEAAAATDPVVAADIAAHRSLRAQLAAAFGPVADERVPEALLKAAALPAEAEVVAFTPRPALSRQTVMAFGAMAACLVAGVLLTFAVTSPRGDFTTGANGLMARGALKQALNVQLAADTAATGQPHIGMTFRDGTGAICRTFSTSANEGLACREGSDWRVDVAARAETKTEFTQASSPLLIQAVEARISGDAFDAETEQKARDGGWTSR